MALPHSNIGADEVTWAAADYPLLIGRNWLRLSAAAGRWTTGVWGADVSDAAAPAAWGYDENDHLQTFGNAVANDWYYHINLGSAIGAIDCVVLLNPLGFSGDGVTIEFCDDQDGAYTPTLTAENQDPAGSKRLVFLNLDHHASGTAQRYSSVQYMRIHFDGANIKPYLGEVIIGRRRQLAGNPKMPYEDKRFASGTGRLISDAGVIRDHVFFEGRRKINAALRVWQTTPIADLDAFFQTETAYGTLPFIWIDQPTTAPTDAYWMRLEVPELRSPLIGYTEREYLVNALEMGPNFLSGGV